jgi:hypothetical protein
MPKMSPEFRGHKVATNDRGDIRLSAAEVVLIGIGLLGSIPLLGYFRWEFPAKLLSPNAGLGWDSVSYHLPGFIEFWQNHTLWSLKGPYQSYSYAFELIGNFLSHPFHARWGLVLADVFAIMLLLAAIAFVARTLIACQSQCTPHATSSWIPVAVLAIAVWSFVHSDSIGDVGKNDVFMTACLVAALGYLLHASTGTTKDGNGRMPAILASSMALGLALGTKPSALAFVPFFALASVALIVTAEQPGLRWRRCLLGTGIAAVVPVALGGFWLARNMVVFGRLSPLSGAWNLSLVANIGNPALYVVKRGSVLFVLGLLAALPGLYLVSVSRRNSRTLIPMSLLLMFHLVACAAFAITPHAIFHNDLHSSVWKLRLGMPLFVSAALILGLCTTHVFAVVSRTSPQALRVMAALTLFLVVSYVPIHWRTHLSSGLPGYEDIKGLPRTGIYSWIGSQANAMRIYSAGLRPYGLYGHSWENTLFYDLHSTHLAPLESGIARISAVVVQFRPDLILISVDPHSYSGGPVKPKVVEWMREHSSCFQEVYSDDTVSGFRVKSAAADQLRDTVPPDYSLRMGE